MHEGESKGKRRRKKEEKKKNVLSLTEDHGFVIIFLRKTKHILNDNLCR